MDKYSVKEKSVEAVRLTPENAEEVAEWCRGYLVEEIDPFSGERFPGINLPTYLGVARVSCGDYVVKHEGDNFIKETAWSFESKYIKE